MNLELDINDMPLMEFVVSSVKTFTDYYLFFFYKHFLLHMMTCGDVLSDMIIGQLLISSKVDIYFTKLMSIIIQIHLCGWSD